MLSREKNLLIGGIQSSRTFENPRAYEKFLYFWKMLILTKNSGNYEKNPVLTKNSFPYATQEKL